MQSVAGIIKYILVLSLVASSSWACRSAAFEEGAQRFVVKSFDFDVSGGDFYINLRDESRTALLVDKQHKPLVWKSKLSSVAFSQIGPGFPFGGMNEAGLTVEALWLTETQASKPSTKLAVNESQFIQYLLDMASNIRDVESIAKTIQIEKAFAPIHYFVCDKNRDCGVIQVTDKGPRFKKIADKDEQVIENVDYAKMVSEKNTNRIFSSYLEHKKKIKSSLENSFAWLDKVKTPGWSRWQIVYDVQNLSVHFRSLNDKGEVERQGSMPLQGPLSVFMKRNNPHNWNLQAFERNVKRFSDAFPQFKPLIPALKKYLHSTF